MQRGNRTLHSAELPSDLSQKTKGRRTRLGKNRRTRARAAGRMTVNQSYSDSSTRAILTIISRADELPGKAYYACLAQVPMTASITQPSTPSQ